MLTDKQILGTELGRQFVFLLDSDGLAGDAGAGSLLCQRALQQLLRYEHVPGLHLMQMSGDCAPAISGIPLLAVTERTPGPAILTCDWGEGSPQSWYLQQDASTLRQRLVSESSQLWSSMSAAEKAKLALLVVAATTVDDTCPGDKDNGPVVCLLITERCALLSQQTQIQKIAWNKFFRVVTPVEATRILELWLKLHNQYLLAPGFLCGEYEWYSLAAISDLSRAAGEDSLVKPLIRRMAAIRYGVDMLGQTYYWHLVGDAMAQQEYHFSSTVILLTALLDGLGLVVNHRLASRLPDRKVSLSPSREGTFPSQFRRAVQTELTEVDHWWQNSEPFLRLLYHTIRNPLAHRGPPIQRSCYYTPISTGQATCTLEIASPDGDVELARLRTQSGEIPLLLERYSSLGFAQENLYGPTISAQQLEPYLFCREAWCRVRALVNETLELLGFADALASVPSGRASPKERAVMFRETALDGLDLTTSEYSQS